MKQNPSNSHQVLESPVTVSTYNKKWQTRERHIYIFSCRDFSQWSAYRCQEVPEWKTKNLFWKTGIIYSKQRRENRNQH